MTYIDNEGLWQIKEIDLDELPNLKLNYVNEAKVGGIVQSLSRSRKNKEVSFKLLVPYGQTLYGERHYTIVQVDCSPKVYKSAKEIAAGDYLLIKGDIAGSPVVDQFGMRHADRCLIFLKNPEQVIEHIALPMKEDVDNVESD